MNEIELDLGDLGVCDIAYDYFNDDHNEEFEISVFYRGDEDGSNAGKNITDELSDAAYKEVVEAIREHEKNYWITYGP